MKSLIFSLTCFLFSVFFIVASFTMVGAQEEGINLSQDSVNAIANELAYLVDQKAAELKKQTEPDMLLDSLNHTWITAVNMSVALIFALLVGMILHRKGVEKGLLRSADEIRDAAELVRDSWKARREGRELTAVEMNAEKQAGQILIAASIVMTGYILGVYMLISAVATPHG